MKKAECSIISVAVSVVFLLSGCQAAPGTQLTISGKNIIHPDNVETDINNFVDVYSITPQLIETMRSKPVIAKSNPLLDKSLQDYQYLIGPGDVLSIRVWDHPEFTPSASQALSPGEGGNSVHADGTLFYPYIGNVSVGGKTASQVRTIVSQKLASVITAPQVDVSVAQFRSQKVYITGEVAHSGELPITNVPLTILGAINQVGGIGENADWNNAVLTRDGHEYPVSLAGLLQNGDLTQNSLLKTGDILYIPRNDTLKIFVMGEVKKQTTLKMDRSGMSLTEALGNAEGIDQMTSDASGIFVIRSQRGKGKEKNKLASVYQLNAKDATALILGTEFALQPYDVVYVTTAPVTRWNRVISQLVPTIVSVYNMTEAAR